MPPSRDAIREVVERLLNERTPAPTTSATRSHSANPYAPAAAASAATGGSSITGKSPRSGGQVTPGPRAKSAWDTTTPRGPRIVTEADLERRLQEGADFVFPPGTRFTPLAQETLDRLQKSGDTAGTKRAANVPGAPAAGQPDGGARDVIAIGADHGGFPLKQQLAEHLRKRGFTVVDCGTESTESCDYPVFARAVGEQVRSGAATAGIVVDGAGIGSAMTVNKMPGVRAAHCHNTVEARNAREHNHAHVVTLGSGFVGLQMAAAIVDTFLATPFGGDRHARRVAMIEPANQNSPGARA